MEIEIEPSTNTRKRKASETFVTPITDTKSAFPPLSRKPVRSGWITKPQLIQCGVLFAAGADAHTLVQVLSPVRQAKVLDYNINDLVILLVITNSVTDAVFRAPAPMAYEMMGCLGAVSLDEKERHELFMRSRGARIPCAHQPVPEGFIPNYRLIFLYPGSLIQNTPDDQLPASFPATARNLQPWDRHILHPWTGIFTLDSVETTDATRAPEPDRRKQRTDEAEFHFDLDLPQ